MTNTIVCTGFHRSGTSLSAQIIQQSGVSIGKELMPGGISNPDGHFEDLKVVELHDKLLADKETNWQYHLFEDFTPPDYTIKNFTSYSNDRKTALGNTQSQIWGFKDPRACLFLSQWKEALNHNGRFIILFRHWRSCLQSLYNRHSGAIAHNLPTQTALNVNIIFWQKPELAARMWLSYNNHILKFIESNPDISLLIPQESLVNDLDLVKEVNAKFSLSLNQPDHSLVRKSYTQSTVEDLETKALPNDLIHTLDDTYLKLIGKTSPNFLKQVNSAPKIINISIGKPSKLKSIVLESIDNYKTKATKKNRPGQSSPLPNLKTEEEENKNLSFEELVTKIQSHHLKPSTNQKKIQEISKQLISVNPNSWKSHEWKGRSALQQNKLSEATNHFKRALELQAPPHISMLIADIYAESGCREEAINYYQQAKKGNPNNPNFPYKLGVFFLSINQTAKSLLEIEKALSINDSLPHLQLAHIKCLGSLSRHEEAIDLAKQYWEKQHNIHIGNKLVELISIKSPHQGTEQRRHITAYYVNSSSIQKWLPNLSEAIHNSPTGNNLVFRLFRHWAELDAL
jgi:tetratricopeptide (TPR) repeat protein